MYEVELKFPLIDGASFVRRLESCGGSRGPAVDQCDRYFNHPARDFARTDEALRIRSVGKQHIVTYKGPVVDSQTKTRREIEVPLAGDEGGEKIAEILKLLGFQPAREVRKHRQTYHLPWHDRQFEIAIDDVAGLGKFVEFETLADDAGRPAALAAILSLVAQFDLPPPERKSYLCLLLERDRQNP